MAASDYVTLKGGVVASMAALRIGWNLEDRGFTLRPLGDKLQVTPPEALTADDVATIKAHRDELLKLASYDAIGPRL